MSNQHVFWQLVKQDMKWRSRRRTPKQWWIAYIAIIAFFTIVVATFGALQSHIDVQFIWLFALGFPFAAFGISIGATVREWKNNTVGWWLTLPFSRRILATSKFFASLIRGIMIFIAVCISVSLFGLYILLLSGDFQFASYFHFLESGLKWFVLLLGTLPFMTALGVSFAVLSHSLAKPVLPIFWVFWGLSWSIGGSTFGSLFTIDENTHFSLSMSMFYPIAASWIAAFLLIQLSAYLLDRHLAL